MLPRILQITAATVLITPIVSWVPSTRCSFQFSIRQSARLFLVSSQTNQQKPKKNEEEGTILDAEILSKEHENAINTNDSNVDQYRSLYEISMDDEFADSDLKDIRIPFLDMIKQTSIDVRLAFMAKIDGVDYGIGVPFDAAAAILIDDNPDDAKHQASKTKKRAVRIPDPTKTLNFVSPDEEADEEIMSIMATQLHEQVSPDLKLLRTPRVLTISGPLNNVTDRWQEELLPKPFSVQELLDPLEEEQDDGMAYFIDFMRKELGNDAVDKVLSEDPDPELMTDEIMELFNMPSTEEIEKDRYEPEKAEQEIEETIGSIDRDVVGLRLVAYFLADGSSYSLVKLLKPVSLVAKYVDSRFEFLKPEEQDIIVPKLQQLYQGDLESAGLQLEQ